MSGLYSLVYSSNATGSVSETELRELLDVSRRANGRAGITGLLLYRNGRFVQFLEGPEDDVRALYRRISADPRHGGIRLLVDGHPQSRTFQDWSMGYEPLATSDEPLPPGFRDSFDDIDNADDSDAVVRATRELSIWFRHRARPVD